MHVLSMLISKSITNVRKSKHSGAVIGGSHTKLTPRKLLSL